MTDKNPNDVKLKQYRNLIFVCGGVLLAVIVFYYIISGSKTSNDDLKNSLKAEFL